MSLNAHAEPPMIGVARNCSRCGEDFKDCSEFSNMRICYTCKKPRGTSRPKDLDSLLGQPLTFREVQVTNLVSQAKLNKEIAHDLHLGEGTIKVFVSTIMAKAGVTNRTALAIWWLFKTNETLRVAAMAGMGLPQ